MVVGALLLVPCLLLPGGPLQADGEGRWQLLDNGDFELAPSEGDIPFWRVTPGTSAPSGSLELLPGGRAHQPVAAWRPRVGGLVVRGVVQGQGILALQGADGRRLETPVEGAFEWAPGEALEPRLLLELRSAGGATTWDDLEVWVPLPDLSEDQLRQVLLAELDWILGLWSEHGVDREGPVKTAFATHLWDVNTAEPRGTMPGWYSIYADALLRGAVHLPERRPEAEALLDDLLQRATHPETGLPRKWDGIRDVALDESPVEVSLQLQVLARIAAGEFHATDAQRARCFEVVERAMAHLLERAPLPDGSLSVRFHPSGKPVPGSSPLRRLDLPAAIAQWVLAGGDADRGAQVIHDALRTLLWDHVWHGEWEAIDPGFDDTFGHHGRRGLDLWEAFPNDALMARITRSGVAYYLPRFEEALRRGGNVAADQVRCWEILSLVAERDQALRPRVAQVLAQAAAVHFKGEQGARGTWSDVTIHGFDPKGQLEVGDTGGVPQNLLHGLALLHDQALEEAGGMSRAEVRARFAAVLDSTREAYRRPFGYLWGREERADGNPSGASLLVAGGLVEMLERLTP